MLTKQLKSTLIATAAATAMLIGGSGTASAVPFIAFNMNYTLNATANTITNAGKINTSDPSLVVQRFDSGLFAGPNGAFTDTGALIFSTWNDVANIGTQTLGGTHFFPNAADDTHRIYLYFQLTGTATTVGSATVLTFNPGGSVKLYTDDTFPATSTLTPGSGNIPVPDGTATPVANFSLLDAGAKGTFATGNLTVTSFAYEFIQTSGPTNLFEAYPGGADLFNGLVAAAFEFGSADVQGHGPFAFRVCQGNEGTSFTDPGGPAGTAALGAGYYCGTPSSVAQFQLAAVSTPEPGTLALFGFGLLGLGFMTRRRNEGIAKA